jgi:hypothetical protein
LPERELVRAAYNDTIRPLFLAALITSFVGLGAGFFAKNYYLGASHNAVEMDKIIRFREKEEVSPEVIAARAREVQERVEREVVIPTGVQESAAGFADADGQGRKSKKWRLGRN